MNKPNIILIMTDHFRPDALGKHTPNLMQLAASGTRFTNAYCAAPLCQPSRLSIITGLFPSQHGVCGNMGGPVRPDLRDSTFMHHLQKAGYYTAMVGKHHYLDRYGIGMDVTEDREEICRYGFDHVFQVVDDAENLHNTDRYSLYLKERGLLEKFKQAFEENALSRPPGPHPFGEDDSADGFIGRNGIEFIDRFREEKPFYLNLSFIGPHPPYWYVGKPTIRPEDVPAPICAPDTEVTRIIRARYLEKCALIDRYVGRLMKTLDERGLKENTVVIFTSDHGDNLGDYGIWEKRYFYENCCGVPFVMAGPGIPREERMFGLRVSKALVSHVDLYPTMLNLAGVDPGSDFRRTGKDIVGMVGGVRAAGVRASGASGGLHSAVFSELSTSLMIHKGNWKMVFDPEQGGITYLFNLLIDPEERENLAGRAGYEGTTRMLMERMLAHRIGMTQYTQEKEEQRLQKVRVGYR